MMRIGLLTVTLLIPQSNSLKAKRSAIKPVLARLHRQFNISAAEIDLWDVHQQTRLGIAVVSDDHIHNEQVLQKVIKFIEISWPDLFILDQKIEHL